MNTDENSLVLLNYATILEEIKLRVRTAQLRATLAVNGELVQLYWQIGRDILAQQQQQGWGALVIDHLSRDLRQAFPEMKGVSPRNIKIYARLRAGMAG